MVRDRMERFVVLPFSIGCTSHSSIDVVSPSNPAYDQRKSPKSDVKYPVHITRSQEGEEELAKETKMKNNTFGFLIIPKQNITSGIHKLIRSIKSLSQVLVYKEEEDVKVREMEIGYPTDVKHVTHIGLDGSTTTMNTINTTNINNPVMGCSNWENLKSTHEMFSFPSISLRQFELAMAAQASSDHNIVHDQVDRQGQEEQGYEHEPFVVDTHNLAYEFK